MSKTKYQPKNMETQTPQMETQSPPLEQMDPAMMSPQPQVEAPEPAVEKRNGRDVIPWEGPAVAHACPRCACRLLADRSTKACIVTQTRALVTDGDDKYRDREMKCLHCGIAFVAREYSNVK
jgi:hypothetical protein